MKKKPSEEITALYLQALAPRVAMGLDVTPELSNKIYIEAVIDYLDSKEME